VVGFLAIFIISSFLQSLKVRPLSA
jgi:hypothetical protein